MSIFDVVSTQVARRGWYGGQTTYKRNYEPNFGLVADFNTQTLFISR